MRSSGRGTAIRSRSSVRMTAPFARSSRTRTAWRSSSATPGSSPASCSSSIRPASSPGRWQRAAPTVCGSARALPAGRRRIPTPSRPCWATSTSTCSPRAATSISAAHSERTRRRWTACPACALPCGPRMPSASRWWATSTTGMAAAIRCASGTVPVCGSCSFRVSGPVCSTNTRCLDRGANCCR